MPKKIRVTDNLIEEALRQKKGWVTLASKYLLSAYGVEIKPNTIQKRISRNDRLKKVMSDIEEEKLDLAETQMFKLLQKEDKAAIMFYLKTKGKDRGWSERQELTGKNGSALGSAQINIVELPNNNRD